MLACNKISSAFSFDLTFSCEMYRVLRSKEMRKFKVKQFCEIFGIFLVMFLLAVGPTSDDGSKAPEVFPS